MQSNIQMNATILDNNIWIKKSVPGACDARFGGGRGDVIIFNG